MRRGTSTGTVVAIVVVVAILAVLGGIGIGKLLFGSSSSSGKQYLVVGTNIPFPPFEDYNYSSGLYVGFDIALAGMFANATHRTLVIQNFADFSLLLTTVGRGGIDMAASAITESGSTGTVRNQSMSFSNSYYDANQAVLVTSSSSLTCPSNVCTAPGLKSLTVAVQTGTTSESWVHDNLAPLMANNATQVKHFTTVDTEITALRAGAVDAVIIDAGPANSIAAASGGALKVTGTIITGELYGFAVAKGDPEGLLPVINSVLSTAVSDGTYASLIKHYFG